MIQWIMAFTLLLASFFAGAATLSGTVSGDGEPLSDVTVVLLDVNKNEIDSFATEIDGVYTFYEVSVSTTYYLTLTPPVDSEYEAVLATVIDIGSEIQFQDFFLLRKVTYATYNVSGHVQTDSGYPIKSMYIRIDGDAVTQGTWTDENGNYSFNVAVEVGGNAHLSGISGNIIGPDFQAVYDYVDGMRTPDFSLTEDSEFNFQLPLVFVKASVVDSNGAAIPAIELDINTTDDTTNTNTYDESVYGFSTLGRQIMNSIYSNDKGEFILGLLKNREFSFNFRTPVNLSQLDNFNMAYKTPVDSNISANLSVVVSVDDFEIPIIQSGPFANSISDTATTIEFFTNEPSYSVVNINGSEHRGTKLRTHHQVTITGLTKNTNYTASVYAEDASANQSLTDNVSFRTLEEVDRQAPIFIYSPIVTQVSHKSVTLTLKTDEATNTSVAIYKGDTIVASAAS